MRTPRKQYVFCKVAALFDFSPRTLNAQSQDGDHKDESAGSFESNSCFPRRPTDDGTIGSFVLSHASASHGVSPNGSDAGASGTGLQASSLDRGIDWGAVRFVLVCARQVVLTRWGNRYLLGSVVIARPSAPAPHPSQCAASRQCLDSSSPAVSAPHPRSLQAVLSYVLRWAASDR